MSAVRHWHILGTLPCVMFVCGGGHHAGFQPVCGACGERRRRRYLLDDFGAELRLRAQLAADRLSELAWTDDSEANDDLWDDNRWVAGWVLADGDSIGDALGGLIYVHRDQDGRPVYVQGWWALYDHDGREIFCVDTGHLPVTKVRR